MQSVIKIGSRESQLAVRQAEIIRDQIMSFDPGITVEIITMKTTGDKILDKSLEKIGGKGLFVKELDRALMDGRIDIAVHSLKDMPMEENPDLPILAYGRREDPRDVILYRPGLEELPEQAVIGTSSRRRMIQMEKLYPGCTFRGIRGNVQTRMRKLEAEGYDATLLAAAGLNRLGMEHVISRYFSVDEMIPAAGQGILAVQGRKGEQYGWTDKIDIPQSRAAAIAERQFIRVTGGDCTSPCAAHAQVSGNELKLTGLYYNEDTEEYSVDVIVTDTAKAGQAGETLAERMMRESL
ncbi:hydroxymethylbilane synthase [Mediterraneibacter glycyrrhizinilyticus]|uniref:hydroxymethylbilane synthase n=1 Tax=Mediterraneibacter glycyrrhizinilyticus TaxID=342942 RepID=UPI0025A3A9AF|nr:hydroxymethylbilane synthase [Mediterraneibacter glycyrrhizinilyticus]MDM8126362.1 hydroxymethylbilane synthase [Mediterraneibacter glycyrrhizinilyticus]